MGCPKRDSVRRRPPAAADHRRPAFTLVELLVVVLVIAILMSLLLVAVQASRRRAQIVVCQNNLHEIGAAATIYAETRDLYPTGYSNTSSVTRWMDLLKPYLQKNCSIYCCPSDPKKIPCSWDPDIILSYGINTFNFVDKEHCFWYTVNRSAVSCPGQVILFADCTPGKYYCGGGNVFKDPVVDVDYRHAGNTFNAVFCDGHVETRTTTVRQDWDAAQ